MTTPLFRDDAGLRETRATVRAITDRGGIVLDQTVFYPTSGGQPGDAGRLLWDNGACDIATTVYEEDRVTIVHVPGQATTLPEPGASVTAILDWERRHRLMRMHTCLHLMCSLIPFPVTGGQISVDESRLDFDIEDAGAIEKDDLTARLNALISADHPISTRWITDEELDANPSLVRTMSVKPPRGSGRVRLVAIGENGSVDLQPCGGTHVASTREICAVAITKIEKKGRLNRRIRVALAE
ncbi:MAG: alanyl-tRNA editing protein [Hyphomicrobiaceae bacterium]